jgi:hypothetical protein
MIAIPDYRGHRIEVAAVVTGMRWNATVRILRLFSQDKPHGDVVTCLKLTPELAEHAGEISAKRWIDLNGEEQTSSR